MSKPSLAFDFALAAIDIDETLITSGKEIGRANRRAIETLRTLGCRVVLASGRRHNNMLPYYDQLGLDDYVVSSQGARVQHASTGEILHHALLDPATSAELVAEGRRRGFGVMLWLNDQVFADRHTPWIAAYEKLADDPVTIAELADLIHTPAEKVVWTEAPDVIPTAYQEMQSRLCDIVTVTVTERWALEFSAREANKREGVAALAFHLGIDRSSVLAFGDGNNDVEMLAWAGMGIAMPHGREAARSAALHVAPAGVPESALARGVEFVLRQSGSAMVA